MEISFYILQVVSLACLLLCGSNVVKFIVEWQRYKFYKVEVIILVIHGIAALVFGILAAVCFVLQNVFLMWNRVN